MQWKLQQKITVKSMSIFNDTNNSINQILEMFKSYRTEVKSKESFFHQAAQNHPQQQVEDLSLIYPLCPLQPSQSSNIKSKLYSSVEKSPKGEVIPLRIFHREMSPQNTQSNIFSRLYEQDKKLRDKRQKLFREARKQNEVKEAKQCTFNPQTNSKVQKNMSQNEIDKFYNKNIDWQQRIEKEIKIKQVQKSSIGINNLTFTPKINPYKRKDRVSRQKQNQILKSFKDTLKIGKPSIVTLEGSRYKKDTNQSPLKGLFSYLH